MNEVIAEWLDAKRMEKEATERRRMLDKKVAALLPEKTEGTSSQTIDGYKVSVDYKVTRKVDTDAVAGIWNDMTDKERDLFRWKAELNMKAYREYQDNGWLASVVTSKAGSPTVTIEAQDGN